MDLGEHIFASLPYDKKVNVPPGGDIDVCEVGKTGEGYKCIGKFRPNLLYGPNAHPDSDETIEIIVGEGIFIKGDKEFPYKPGDTIKIPKNVLHGIKTGDTETIVKSTQSKQAFNPE